MKKNILAIAMAFAMIFALTACGGGGSGAPAGDSSEANAGVGDIVFTVPDDWTTDTNEPGRYVSYEIPDSDFMLSVSTFSEEDIESYNEWSDEDVDSVQDYYDKAYAVDKKTAKEKNIDVSEVKICGVDGVCSKYSDKKKGVMEIATSWLLDNTVYTIFIYNPAAYDDEGKIVDEATSLSSDMNKTYDAVVASVKPGDGTAVQKETLAGTATSLGDITYDVPEGYSVASVYDANVIFEKDGSEITLDIFMTDESMLESVENPDGSNPKSLEEYFDADGRSEEDETKIAGYTGYVYKYPDENDKYYNVNAEFMTENAVYHIQMDSDAYDDDGNIKDGAEELSKEDLAVFDNFIASIRKK